MTERRRFRILFTGYAPVHFVCFRPLYEQLAGMPWVDVYVSGGLRTTTPEETLYDTHAMYAPFRLRPGSVLPVDHIREMDFDVLFCANTKRIEPRSASLTIQMFHGMSFRNRAVREENLGADFYFIFGPYMRRLFEQSSLLSPGDPRALSIGFPKTDRLLNGTIDRERILQAYGMSGDRPVILFAPTGEKRNSLETMGEELICRLRETDGYDLLIKPHDHSHGSVDWFERLAVLEGAHVRLVRDPDVIPFLFVADLLITDASSVSNEYSLLDRPMVFLDVPDLIKAAVKKKSLVDLDTWGRNCGEVAGDASSAVASVADGFERPKRHSQIRQDMVANLFYNPGRATDTAIEWLRGELALR